MSIIEEINNELDQLNNASDSYYVAVSADGKEYTIEEAEANNIKIDKIVKKEAKDKKEKFFEYIFGSKRVSANHVEELYKTVDRIKDYIVANAAYSSSKKIQERVLELQKHIESKMKEPKKKGKVNVR